jgi:hypothetical protein
MPLQAIQATPPPAANLRRAVSSVAPVSTDTSAPYVLARRAFRAAVAGPDHLKGH